MKKDNSFINQMAWLCSFVYPLEIWNVLRVVNKYIYSAKIKRKIKVCGNNFKIVPSIILKGEKYIQIGQGFRAGKGMRLECWDMYNGQSYNPCLKIKDNVIFGEDCHVGCILSVSIGCNLLTGKNVYITDHFHGTGSLAEASIPPRQRNLYAKGAVIIGENVWLGDNVTVLPGVTIGNNVTVGAGAVVTKNLPNNSIAAGVPAKVIRLKN